MGIRDTEILRMTKYAEGLGIKVHFKPHEKGCGEAEWDMDTQEIFLYTSSGTSKTTLILSFLHELGHHLDWIYNNKKDTKQAAKAYELLNRGNIEGDRSDIPQKYRNIILKEEESGIYYMDLIYKELDLSIPLWKVKMQQDLDLLEYKTLAKKARFLTNKEARDFRKNNKLYYMEKYKK